ncbi:hypothetical protein CI610_00505 [invertebrate metagenome]|uniref:Uncharacterized protein n=1 Tax=invertebrate metagenome TaxID=1711999 RepID=A0A2H9TBB1_9ZZZZ
MQYYRCIMRLQLLLENAQVNALINGSSTDYVLDDRGYDSDVFEETITNSEAVPVIPLRCSRKQRIK